MSTPFDLDLSFEDQPAEPDFSGISAAELEAAVTALPATLKAVAQGILVERRTMSDVSQALGIRQSELVTRLHRAKLAIASGMQA